jgi:hypothetical protein
MPATVKGPRPTTRLGLTSAVPPNAYRTRAKAEANKRKARSVKSRTPVGRKGGNR